MIEDFLAFFEYYSEYYSEGENRSLYEKPMIKIVFPEVSIDGDTVDACLTPLSHALNTLCYKDLDEEFFYSQKEIADVCHVSQPAVSLWRTQKRIPDKYNWFLLLVDIAHKASTAVEDPYILKTIHPGSQEETEKMCNNFLRLINCCYEPYCLDDYIIMDCILNKKCVFEAEQRLKQINPDYWNNM